MKIFKARFIGRQAGAIGRFEEVAVMVSAENKEKARLKLYDEYEHIQNLEIEEIEDL